MIFSAGELRISPLPDPASPFPGAVFLPRLDQPAQFQTMVDCASPTFVVPFTQAETRNALGFF